MNSSLFAFLKKNTDHYQINTIESDTSTVTITNNEISDAISGINTKHLLKVWIGEKYGFAFSNAFDDELVKKAVKIAKLNEKKEYFYGLPEKTDYSYVEKHDKKLWSMNTGNLVDYAADVINKIRDDIVIASNGSVTLSKERMRVNNSNGVDVQNTSASLSVVASGVTKDKLSNYYASRVEPFFFSFDEKAKKIKKEVKDFLKVKKLVLRNKDVNVVFSPEAFSELLENAFLENLNALNYEKDKSLFSGQLGQKVIGNVKITDDGTLKKGVDSSKSDYEGTPKQKTVLINKGVLNNLVFDFNTAIHNNTKSTGNANHNGIAFSNVVFQGPKGSFEKYVLVDSLIGAHTSNSLTTDFSVKVEKARLVSKSENTPLKPFMIRGKLADVLNNIVFVGKDVENNAGIYSGSVGCKGVKITV